MKLRGTLGGLNLLLEPGDTGEGIRRSLQTSLPMLATHVTFEVQGDTHAEALETAMTVVREAGGTLGRVRAPRVTVNMPPATADLPASAQTVIVPHSVRAGFRGEYRGSVVVLGDVNPGAELIAGGDVIVAGALRGVVHAGYGGTDPDAIVWARPIASAQIRIGHALARAPEGSSNMRRTDRTERAERAYLQDGMIVIDVQ
ncbi:septum site-determining protein MinC [Deinococcus reticulitermitis]|uniref:Septum site-determining protein MinC n=1 Tax=Deinococcus reticulitermitis TaxID=856736 RepID=A0A1H6VGY2_9DEIO|nr:septum site-determining protein MinC [Deinococcus reticulitermitis]SEJ02976.1 septum site-determining protein MinC [Deinococcus reticulitermitis]